MLPERKWYTSCDCSKDCEHTCTSQAATNDDHRLIAEFSDVSGIEMNLDEELNPQVLVGINQTKKPDYYGHKHT